MLSNQVPLSPRLPGASRACVSLRADLTDHNACDVQPTAPCNPLLIRGSSVKADCRDCGPQYSHYKRGRVCGRCSERPTWICRYCRDNNGNAHCCWASWPDGEPPNPNPPALKSQNPPGGLLIGGTIYPEGTDPLWRDVAPADVARWGGVNDSALALVGRAARLINATPGAGFTAQLAVRYRREGTALLVPDTVTSRTQRVLTRPGTKVRATFRRAQVWPIPDSAEVADILSGSRINASRLLGKVTGSGNPYEAIEHVVQLRIVLEEGDNHVLFLSRLYSLLHSAATVAAAGGRWEQRGVVERPTVFAPQQHWATLLTGGATVVMLSDLWSVAVCQVLMVASADELPVVARLPGTAQMVTSLSWDVPTGCRMRVFARQDTPAPTAPDLPHLLSVKGVMAAIDEYVSMYRLQNQWQYVVNCGTLGIFPIADVGPELPRPAHASEILYSFWEAGMGGAGAAVALPPFVAANPARGVLAQALVHRVVKHSLTWTMHEFAVHSARAGAGGTDITSYNNSGPLTYPALGLGLGRVVLQQVARGGAVVAGIVANAAPESIKPVYSALGPRAVARLMVDASHEGTLEGPLPMAPVEWAMVGVSSADPGCSVLSDCSFQGYSLAGAAEMATALEVAKMGLLGMTRNAGTVPEHGPDLPIDVHTLVPLPMRALGSRTANSYLRGKTLKLVPKEITASSIEWSTPVDLDHAGLLPSWAKVTAPAGPHAVWQDAADQVGSAGAPSVSDGGEGASDPALIEPEPAEVNRAPAAYGRDNLPDSEARAFFRSIREVAALNPGWVVPAPEMTIVNVPGDGQCAANALAKSAEIQGLDSQCCQADFWVRAAGDAGLTETRDYGW